MNKNKRENQMMYDGRDNVNVRRYDNDDDDDGDKTTTTTTITTLASAHQPKKIHYFPYSVDRSV